MSGPRRAINHALDFLSRADSVEADKIRASLGGSLPRCDDDEFGSLSQSALTHFDGSIVAIANALAVNRSSLIARSSPEEYRWALQNLEVSRQLTRFFHVMPATSARDPMMREDGPEITARDYAMAQNVRWAVEHEGPTSRIIVFAHNNHVMNWKEDGGIWANVREKPSMMGSYLRSAYPKSLLIIATSSATATVGLPTPEPLDDSIDSAFARVGPPTMFLDLRPAQRNSEVLGWLSMPRPLHANISTHVLITPSSAVDAFFFVDKLTPALISPF